MKYPFYQLYTYWVIILFIFYLAKVIKFSILPSLIGAFIGTILFFAYKLSISNSRKINYNLVLLLLLLHLLPIFFVPSYFTVKDFVYNLIIFIIYLISLTIQNTNIIKVYRNLVEGQKENITIRGHFKEIGLLP